MLGARNMVCGLHVHVEVPEPDRRVDLMNRLLPFTPLLLALSASSPFWQQQRTGLASYRLAAYRELPRTGLPDLFDGWADYARYVRVLEKAGAIRDASFLWWVMRPSAKYPTLELRVADSCTRLADAIGIAALYRCLVRLVVREPALHGGLTGASRAIVAENLWRAQRDGSRADLIDEADESTASVADRLATLLALVAEDADALGCGPALEALRDVARLGTSADRQIAIVDAAPSRGRSAREGLSDVVDWLAAETTSSTA
jgi:carboxylate-amine ligase